MSTDNDNRIDTKIHQDTVITGSSDGKRKIFINLDTLLSLDEYLAFQAEIKKGGEPAVRKFLASLDITVSAKNNATKQALSKAEIAKSVKSLFA